MVLVVNAHFLVLLEYLEPMVQIRCLGIYHQEMEARQKPGISKLSAG